MLSCYRKACDKSIEMMAFDKFDQYPFITEFIVDRTYSSMLTNLGINIVDASAQKQVLILTFVLFTFHLNHTVHDEVNKIFEHHSPAIN